MNTALKALQVVMLLWLALLVVPSPAHAYLDPGTGSMLLQLLLGGVAGFVVLMKMGWRRILGFLGLRKEESAPPEEDKQPHDQASDMNERAR